jgi:hypothetical protein
VHIGVYIFYFNPQPNHPPEGRGRGGIFRQRHFGKIYEKEEKRGKKKKDKKEKFYFNFYY